LASLASIGRHKHTLQQSQALSGCTADAVIPCCG